jgi:D-psicose/D-tagatose/L-ribulose 3-epimerase
MRNIGIYYAYWTDDWDTDFLPFIPKVKSLGFDQLEINGGALVSLSKGERQRLKESALENGITLSYGIGLTADHDVSSLNESIRKEGVNFMKKMIGAVAEMGGGMIGGTVHSYWPATAPDDLSVKEQILKKSHKSMKEMIPMAEDLNVILNVEVINRFEQFLLNTCQEAVDYVEIINSPNCKILLDTFHMNIEEDSFGDAIRLAGSHLSALHLGETNRKPPGCGRIPWSEIKTALDDIHFEGPLVMEPFIKPGGQVGKDIALWRDLMPTADLDKEAAKSVLFVKKNLL